MNSIQIVATVFITIGFILIGYFLGSVVWGPIIMRKYHKDIHSAGSGNPGATNVVRVGGKGLGLLVAFLDAAKGYVAVALSFLIYHFSIREWAPANHNGENICLVLIYLAGTFAIIGHCYPIQYLIALIRFKGDKAQSNKYKGGKGVATTGGVLFAVSPWLALIAFLIFVVVLLIFRYVSLGSMTCLTLAIFFIWVPKIMFLYMIDPHWDIHEWDWQYKLVIMILLLYNTIIVIFRHKENIVRIINKKESKIF